MEDEPKFAIPIEPVLKLAKKKKRRHWKKIATGLALLLGPCVATNSGAQRSLGLDDEFITNYGLPNWSINSDSTETGHIIWGHAGFIQKRQDFGILYVPDRYIKWSLQTSEPDNFQRYKISSVKQGRISLD